MGKIFNSIGSVEILTRLCGITPPKSELPLSPDGFSPSSLALRSLGRRGKAVQQRRARLNTCRSKVRAITRLPSRFNISIPTIEMWKNRNSVEDH